MWKFLLIFSLFSSTFCTSTNETSGRQNATNTISDNNLANLTNAHSAAPPPPQSMNSVKNDLLFLSEMPLEQLLKVKKSIEEIQQVGRQMSNHRHNFGAETAVLTTAGTTLESRIINEQPQKFELGSGNDKLMSSAMPLINVNQQKQPTINRLNLNEI